MWPVGRSVSQSVSQPDLMVGCAIVTLCGVYTDSTVQGEGTEAAVALAKQYRTYF